MSLSETNIGPALTGQALIDEMAKSKERRKPLIEGLLYERTMVLVSADPGTGKSTLAAQMMVEAAAGLPVFGVLTVPRPLRFLYAQTERDILELLERIDNFSKIYPIAKENIYVTDEYQKFNMLNPDHVHLMVKCMKRDCPDGVDVIVFDPIYSMVSGGLSKDEPASAFTHGMSIIHKEIGACHWYNHHTVKPEYYQGKKVEKEDPFYGSQWLKAHCTGAFALKRNDKGATFQRKKDNYGVLAANLELEYNEETGQSMLSFSELPPAERIKSFINLHKISGKPFFFEDLVRETNVCTRSCRQLVMHTSIKSLIIEVSTINRKKLYKAAP